MFRNVEQPLKGSPHTSDKKDANGHPRFTIRAFELTPLRAKVSDAISAVILLMMVLVAICWIIDRLDAPLAGTVSRLAFLAAVYLVFAGLVRLGLHRLTRIEMSTSAISVRHLLGWQRFDRNIEHSFALLFHDAAREEQKQNEFDVRKASANGEVIRKVDYYGESFHVVLVYAGQRRDLLCVYGQKEASAIVARLQYCDRCLNEAMRMGGGIHQRPEDEWNEVPGGLQED